jgi:hypothetical protein
LGAFLLPSDVLVQTLAQDTHCLSVERAERILFRIDKSEDPVDAG